MADLEARTEAVTPATIHVQAQPDHLEALTRSKPINALAELVWNSLDANADVVRVLVTDNALGSPDEIIVTDNGDGIPFQNAIQAFGNLGGSWKKTQRKSTARKLHGRDGKGRFKAFSLGREVRWETCTQEPGGGLKEFTLLGKIEQLQDFILSPQIAARADRQRGTTVQITKLQDVELHRNLTHELH